MAEPKISWLTERRARIEGLHHPNLKHPRPIDVHVPSNWQEEGKAFPVLYNLDGEYVLSKVDDSTRNGMEMDAALDRLVELGAASPAILVAIPNSKPQNRGAELGPEANRQDPPHLHQFIKEVVHPFLKEHFPLLEGPQYTGITGFSLGGLTAFNYGWRFPEVYGLVGAISPSLQMRRDLVQETREGEGKFTGTRFWFGNGGHEFIERNWIIREVIENLTRRGWAPERDVQFALQYGGGHSYGECAERMTNMLGFLLIPLVDPPEPLGVRISAWEDADAEKLDVSQMGEGARALLRLDYPHDRFSHLLAAQWSDRDGLFHLDPEDPGLPVPAAGGGVSVIDGQWLHWKADCPAIWDTEEVAQFSMIRKEPEATLENWNPREWQQGADPEMGLALAESSAGLLIAIRAPASTQRVQLGLDSGSLHRLPLHRHLADKDDIPGDTLRAAAGFTEAQVAKQKALVVGEIRDGANGREARFFIPHERLDKLDNAAWDILRINAFARTEANDDADDGSWFWWKRKESDHWWQPPWRSKENIVGSGILIRRG